MVDTATLKRVQSLIAKASSELESGKLQAAWLTATEAIDIYLVNESSQPVSMESMMLRCHAQVAALLLQKTGATYKKSGQESGDPERISKGDALIEQSSMLLEYSLGNPK